MKLKLLLGIALLAALLTGISLWQKRTSTPARSASTSDARTRDATKATPVSEANYQDQSFSQHVEQNPQISVPFKTIVNWERDYAERVTAASSLTTNITAVEWQTLHDFLLLKDSRDAEQVGQVFKNHVLDVLCALNPPPEGLGNTLVELYRDYGQNSVIRDYAIQHLVAYYEQLELSAQSDASIQRRIQDVLWEALAETDNSIAGTALLGLKHLSDEHKEIDRERIAKSALGLASEGSTGELTRISAFQVCAQLKVAEIEPLLSQTALNGETVALRICAIGALGQMGNSQSKPLLMTIMQGNEERLRLPAEKALARIEKLEKQQSGS
jgi:hypothetical protein